MGSDGLSVNREWMVSRGKKRQRRTGVYLYPSNEKSKETSATYWTMSLTLRFKHSANVQCITYARKDSYPKVPNKDTSRLVSFCPTTYVKTSCTRIVSIGV